MNEQEYYYNKASQETACNDLKIATLIQQQEYNLTSMLRPTITKDGNQWCVLYGVNLQEGIAGFGETPHKAIIDFNQAFYRN